MKSESSLILQAFHLKNATLISDRQSGVTALMLDSDKVLKLCHYNRLEK